MCSTRGQGGATGQGCEAGWTDAWAPLDTLYLHHHLGHEDRREDVVGDAEEDALLQRTG